MTIHISTPAREILNAAALQLFSMTPSEAFSQKICIRCKEPAMCKLLSRQQLQNYKQTALCPKCHTELTKPEDENSSC